MEAIQKAIDGNANIGSYIVIGILVYVAITVLSGFIYGIKRGFSKSILRLVTIVAAAFVSYLAVIWLSGYVDEFFAGKTVDEIVRMVWKDYETATDPAIRDIISGFDAETSERIVMAILTLATIPPLFVAVFYICKILTMIVYGIFAGIIGLMSKEKSFISGLFGGIVGAVQGALIAAVVLLPTAGFLGVAADAYPTLVEGKPEETQVFINDIYDNYLNDVIDSEPVVILRTYGGDEIFALMTNVTVAGETVDMREEAIAVTEIAVDSLPLFQDEFNWKQLTPLQKEALRSILDDVDDSDYNGAIIAGLLRGVCKCYKAGSVPLEIEEPFNSFALQLISVFESTTSEYVADDLSTLVEIYFILGDSGVLNAFDSTAEDDESIDVKELLVSKNENGETVIDQVINELNSNERTVPIVTSLTKFSLELMLDAFPHVDGMPEDIDINEVYDNVKDGVNDLLDKVNDPDATPEEKKATVAESLDTTLKENNIAIEPEIIDSIADHVLENFAGMDQLTDEDINNALLAFYGAYADQLAGGEIPEIPEGIIPAN